MKTEKERSRYFNKLIKISEDEKYDPVTFFKWEECIGSNEYWMSPELLSVYNTPYYNQLSESELKELSKWELINFFSMSVHGERNIKMDMLKYLNTKYFVEQSDYFVHFLGEENSHIYFFSRFCKQTVGKLYSYMSIPLNSFQSYDVDRFIVFAQTLIAEEIGDYFNVIMSKDERLPDLIRAINKQHHLDESRHISMGKILCKGMWQELKEKESLEKIIQVQSYLLSFMRNFLRDFYNPEIYKDSKIDKPYEFRENIINSLNNKDFHLKVCGTILSYLKKNQMITQELYG